MNALSLTTAWSRLLLTFGSTLVNIIVIWVVTVIVAVAVIAF